MLPDNNHRHRHALLAIFVLSGFAGLIYQSIWSHYLGLFLGHAAYAQALVLAIFMGGMATGAAWIAHAGQRWRNLIRGYALIEAAIGVLGLLFHWIFTGVAAFSYDWLIPALGSPWAVDIARWSIAALLILPQTILLGMTFPLMSGGLIRRFPGREGSLLGGLYFTNSIGAAIGALAAVFILLPWVGLPGAMVAAGILNFLVAALAWWLAREPEPVLPPLTVVRRAPEQRLLRNPLLRIVLFGTALSGAASFVYEIVWIRMLSMAVGSTMHAFELMLASFIAGIALGGLWVRKRADSADSPLRLVGWMQVGMGVAALASLGVYANAFSWVGWLIGALAKTDGGYALFNAGTATIAIAIMLPAAFFAGTTLPLFTVTLLRAGQGERSIGRVYAWNTLGSILGVFAAIHLLIPVIGLKLTLCFAALVDIAIGLVLLRMQAHDKRSMLRFAGAVSLSALCLIFAVKLPFDPLMLASGVFRHGRSELAASSTVLFYRDGKTASISVVGSSQGSAHIATNGKPDAAIMLRDDSPPSEDEPTMAIAALLPLTMLDAPDRVGVIGFGSGLTTHTLLGDKRVLSVDTVEIEQAIVDGARNFGKRVRRAYEDPRSNIIIDDAKSYFSSKREKYDVIISEPSNPWISGVGTLFSKEFYKFIPKNLTSNGLFVQWIQLYEIDEELVGSILRALIPEFQDYEAYLTNSSDLLIVASPNRKIPNVNLEKLFANEPLNSELLRLGLSSSENIKFRKIADARLLRAFADIHDVLPANSDFFPVLGLNAPRSRFENRSAAALLTLPFQSPLLLEATGIRSALPSSLEPPKNQHFVADVFTWRARALVKELLHGSGATVAPDILSGNALNPASLMKAAVPACGRSWTPAEQHRLSARVKDFADQTINFLPADMQKDIWKNPTWHPCLASMSPEFKKIFALFSSMAERDFDAMLANGQDWFQKPIQDQLLKIDFDPVALSAIQLSLAQQNRWHDVTTSEQVFGKSVVSNGDYGSQRVLLNSMAKQ